MSDIKNWILIYDDNCPLCTGYSGLFVKYAFKYPLVGEALRNIIKKVPRKQDVFSALSDKFAG